MTQRREFLKAAIASSLAVSMSNATAANGSSHETFNVKPKRLASGNLIGLIAPSTNVLEDEEIQFARDILRSFGFRVKFAKHLFDRFGYLAGKDKDRADDVNKMFADKQVDAIFCLRGGYGSPRILPYLDYGLIKKNPKILIGYSDVTALLNAIYARTGLITFHGPIATQNFTQYTVNNFKKVLFKPSKNIELATPPPFEMVEGQAERDNRLTVIYPGKAFGRLIGGSLSLMVQLVGTPFEPDYKNKILVLEDVEEQPYRIDGMLTHLLLAGRLNQVAGIAFGKCSDCGSKGNSLSIEQVIRDRLGNLNIPVIKGMMIGHINDMATLPIGALATLDATKKRLVLEETAVS